MLCYTPHTTAPVYIKPFFFPPCFPFQKERCQSLEADVFIKTCISKPDMRSAASGAAEKQSVNSLERASQRGRRGTGPAPVPAKSYKRRESQTQAEQTFSIHSAQYLAGGRPNHKPASSYVKGEAFFFLIVIFLNSPFSPFGDLFCP